MDLWSATGTLLATATSTSETASGWQQVNFSSPVKISAGTTYIASYYSSGGEYSDTPYYFDTLQAPTNGSLAATANGLNGVFAYSLGNTFPSNISSSGDNYWVDVVFNNTSAGIQANNDSGFIAIENIPLSIAASQLLANDTDSNGLPLSITGVNNPIDGTVSYDPNTRIVTFMPTTAGTANFTYSVTDGSASASGYVSITVNNPPTAQTLFFVSDTPAAVTADDANRWSSALSFRLPRTARLRVFVSIRVRRTRAPMWRILDGLGHFAGECHLHQRECEWLAASQFLQPGSDNGRDDLCGVLPYQWRLLSER